MAIQHCESFLLETLTGTHDFSSDVIKIALFTGDATFSSATTTYSATNEITAGDGYTAGGATMTVSSTYPKIESQAGAVRFDAATWAFTASKLIRWALVYNSSQSNKAILSIDLGSEITANGPFTLNFPLSAPPLIYQRAPMPAS